LITSNKVPLQGNPYQGRSPIASAQRAVNIYAESNDASPQSPFEFTQYLTPGSLLFTAANVPAGSNGKVRGCYRTTSGTAYAVVGPTVYALTSNGGISYVGSIADAPSQVYMADNGLAVVLVDGSSTGYAIDMASNTFGPIIDPSFLGADFVQYLDTFFVFNRPTTNQFYISLSLVDFNLLTAGTSFDPLDIAAKSGSADPIASILVLHQNLWLIGTLTTEIWIGTGAADFFFQQVQGAYIDHGSGAPNSQANQDVVAFWLMQDRQGFGIVVQATGYDVAEISTPYIVGQIQSYDTVADAIGFCFQGEDHSFYALIFPTVNKGWLYDLTTKQWTEWGVLDAQGNIDRPRANCCMFAFGKILVGDFENGQIIQLSFTTYTDLGKPIWRLRTFMHMVKTLNRITYKQFIAYMEAATANPPEPDIDFPVFLRWSDDGGITYGQPVRQYLGQGGKFNKQVYWNRLGMARDRMFELTWSEPFNTALNGAYVDVEDAES
jgi:hypothetical protein